MFLLETRSAFDQEHQNMFGKKGHTKITHTDQKNV